MGRPPTAVPEHVFKGFRSISPVKIGRKLEGTGLNSADFEKKSPHLQALERAARYIIRRNSESF
jgi:hypothetical protein